MAKQKKKTNINKKQPQKMRVARVPTKRPGLSEDELAYARQLVDPCGAPMKAPPIGGSEGSFIYRSRGMASLNNGPTGNEYNGTLLYHPTFGAFYSSGTGTAQTFNAWDTLVYLPTLATPATSGLATRTVGACLKVRYLGAELNRQGKVAYGVIPGQVAWTWIKNSAGGGGAPPTTTSVAASLEHVSRMPPDELEVAWVPGSVDHEFHEPQYYTAGVDVGTVSAYEELLSRTNFIAVTWAGIGSVDQPIEFEVTAIQEKFLDTVASGTLGNQAVVTAGKRNKGSAVIMDKVISWLQSKDASWYLNGAMRVGRMLGMSTQPLSLIASVGNLSMGMTRTRQAIAYG